ncbi:MAG: hypothetical protein CMK59_15160 [Proteobacteria bacterium]|nr:hypothetical protein [Pseudomonadota bacterium]
MLWLLIHSVSAQRPTQGGMFSFDDEDLIETLDAENVRVHYSLSGPNQVLLEDQDQNGIPDYPELVALTALEVLEFYALEGFKPPVTEAQMGLLELGGSEAFDFYLVDFGGSADGQFGIDACDQSQCSGFMVIENDFEGYGYGSIEEATRVLVSHELFHAVQAAYRIELSSWLSEGTAVWAEHIFDSELWDFYGLCGFYLEDPTRSLDRPPVGMVSGFSYGTALFFDFIALQLGTEFWVEYFDLLAFDPQALELDLLEELLMTYETSLSILWPIFSQWNLASGYRSGLIESYPYADFLAEVPAEEQASVDENIHKTHRFFPLSSVYFFIEHAGGTLNFVIYDDLQQFASNESVRLSLMSISDEGASIIAPVNQVIDAWELSDDQYKQWELPAGGYWLVGSHPYRADESTKVEFCFGATCDLNDDNKVSSPSKSEKKGGCSTVNPGNNSVLMLFCAVFAVLHRRRFYSRML